MGNLFYQAIGGSDQGVTWSGCDWQKPVYNKSTLFLYIDWLIELWLSEKSMETMKIQILTIFIVPSCNVATPTLLRGASPLGCTPCTLHRSLSCRWNRRLAELWGVMPLSFSIPLDDQDQLQWWNSSFFSGLCWDSPSWPPREWLLSPPWPLHCCGPYLVKEYPLSVCVPYYSVTFIHIAHRVLLCKTKITGSSALSTPK